MTRGTSKYTAPDNAQPWERMTNESSQAFGAWLTYMELPPGERSLSRVASDLSRSGTLIANWSGRWQWQQRIGAWEQHLKRAEQRGAVVEAERMGKRQATHLASMAAVLILPAQELLRRLQDGKVKWETLTDAELYGLSILGARVMPQLVRAERLVRGQPTDIVEAADEDGRSHIPLEEEWSKTFYGTLETLGIVLTQDGLGLPALPAGEDSESVQGDRDSG